MTKKEKINVQDTIDNEGFDYTFRAFTSFKEIKDEQFHMLRLNYIKAANELEQYINK